MKNKYTITFSIFILILCSCSFLLGNDGLLEDCESVKTKCIQAFNASSYLKIIAFCFGYLSLGSQGVRTLGWVVRTCYVRARLELQTNLREDLIITEKVPTILGPSPGWKHLLVKLGCQPKGTGGLIRIVSDLSLMVNALVSYFHIYLSCGQCPFSIGS